MRTPTVGLSVWRAVLSACIGLSGFAAACGDSSRAMAQDILNRTIPSGDTVPSLSEPVRMGQSLQFTWDFETHMSSSDYADWLKARLKEFQVVDEDESDLHLETLVGGDAYRLHVTVQAATGGTRVHDQLAASPD